MLCVFLHAGTSTGFGIKSLAQELMSVNNRWFELGIHLGVTHSELEEIRHTYSNASAGELMIHMLESWLKSGTSCSWSDVIIALKSYP